MEDDKYLSYPEGFEKLANDLKMPYDDPAIKKMMLEFLVGTLINN